MPKIQRPCAAASDRDIEKYPHINGVMKTGYIIRREYLSARGELRSDASVTPLRELKL